MGRLGLAAQTTMPGLVAGVSLAVLSVWVLVLVAGPIDTSDFWFHAKMGQVYATEGPWPEGDPLLHTAHAEAPVQHEWLFGVLVHGVERATGFTGVRLFHALTVAGLCLLLGSIFWRASRSAVATCGALCVFLALAWPRLIQMRPDLITFWAVFLMYRLLLESGQPPTGRRIAAACGLAWVWANTHSLFGIGPLLLVAALMGVGVRIVLRRSFQLARSSNEGALAGRLFVALVLMLLVSLLNPRGWEQLLTFFTSSSEAGIWAIHDEWSPFSPFSYMAQQRGSGVSLLSWGLVDLLFVMLGLTAVVSGIHFLRRRSEETLRAIDPVAFGLALASCVAVLVSVRFFWMLAFVLLFLLSQRQSVSNVSSRKYSFVGWAIALASVALVASVPQYGGYNERASRLPDTWTEYWEQPWSGRGYPVAGMRFLADTGVEGNLFNRYTAGGFLGYWLSPKLRTFVDGRTEHYPAQVLEDYFRITRRLEVRPGETSLEALDRREVDFYVGIGMPIAGAHIYTSANLENAPGWIPVFRTPGQAIYLRMNERNQENLQRIADYYESEGVPFDGERGFDADRVVAEAPDWAVARGVLSRQHDEWLRARFSADNTERFDALNALSRTYALLGAYETQIAIDRGLVRTHPDSKSVNRRMVYGLLHAGRIPEALASARELARLDPRGPRSLAFVRGAREYARRRQTEQGDSFARARTEYAKRRIAQGNDVREEGWLIPADNVFGVLPLLTPQEMYACCREFE